jgi:hypothetical protein
MRHVARAFGVSRGHQEEDAMRTAVMVLCLLAVTGCGGDRDRDRERTRPRWAEVGRWQILQQPNAAGVWRIDTLSGSLTYCRADFTTGSVACMQPIVPPLTSAATPGTGAAIAPATAPPVGPEGEPTAR